MVMAYNIPMLRQKSILDQYGLGQDFGNDGLDQSGLDQYGSDSSIDPSTDPSNNADFQFPTPMLPIESLIRKQPHQIPEMPHQIQPQPAPTDTTPKKSDYEQMMEIYDKMYTPQHTATDRLNTLLDQFPKQDAYQPGLLRRLAALGVGLGKGGMKAQNEVLDAPYRDELASWKERAAPFQSAATLENQQNINERQLAASAAANTVAGRRAEETTRTNTAKEEIARQKNEIAWAKSQGATFDTKGPRIIVKFPDGTTADGGPTNNWSPIEIQNLKSATALAVSQQQGRNAANVANIQGTDILVDSEGNTYQRTRTGIQPKGDAPPQPVGPLTKPGTAPKETPLKPGDVPKLLQDRLQEAYDNYPQYRSFINFDSDTQKYTLKEPQSTSSYFGLGTPKPPSAQDKATYDELRKKIYPEATSTLNPPARAGGPGRAGGPAPTSTRVDPAQRQRAIDQVKKDGMPVTEANIAYAISSGRVK
jgi:hypothetical protein